MVVCMSFINKSMVQWDLLVLRPPATTSLLAVLVMLLLALFCNLKIDIMATFSLTSAFHTLAFSHDRWMFI
jgi:hypothetical protein